MTAAHDDPLLPLDDGAVARLHARLAERADAECLLDVAYRLLDTPVGTVLLAATEAGLVRVAFAAEDLDAVLVSLAQRISPRVLHAPARLDGAAAQLDDYFRRGRRDFTLPLDRRLSAGFRRTVQDALLRIPFGDTSTYGEIAARTGHPGAARAVGTACATNPLPIVVPCHRVLPASGGVGGYLGGPEAKSVLLALESAA